MEKEKKKEKGKRGGHLMGENGRLRVVSTDSGPETLNLLSPDGLRDLLLITSEPIVFSKKSQEWYWPETSAPIVVDLCNLLENRDTVRV